MPRGVYKRKPREVQGRNYAPGEPVFGTINEKGRPTLCSSCRWFRGDGLQVARGVELGDCHWNPHAITVRSDHFCGQFRERT